MMRWIRRRKEGGSWRSDRAPCPFQWSQPVVGVNGSFAAISWNRTDKTSNSGCWRWRPQQHQQHLVDTMTTKRGCHSSDTSPNWNGPSIFIFSSLNFSFLLCVTPPYFFTLGIFIRINFSFFKINSRSETLLLERVRHSVRAVVPCNVLLTNPLMNDKEAAQNADGNSLYDVIITTLCLEFATLSVDEYSAAVGNVTRLLSPGGFLVVQVNIFWTKNKWWMISIVPSRPHAPSHQPLTIYKIFCFLFF